MSRFEYLVQLTIDTETLAFLYPDTVGAALGRRQVHAARDLGRADRAARSRAEGRTASYHTNLAQGWVFP